MTNNAGNKSCGKSGFMDFFIDLLTRLASCDFHEADETLNRCLKEAAGFFKVDLIYDAFLSPDGTAWSVAHSWKKKGIKFPIESFQRMDRGAYPWAEKALTRYNVIKINTLKDFPPEAEIEKIGASLIGAKSELFVPIRGRKNVNIVNGFIGLYTFTYRRRWDDITIQRVKLIGEIIANAMERKYAESKVQDLRNALDNMSRLRVLNELAASMAHELNQPLTSIMLHLNAVQELLKNGTRHIDKVRCILPDILADARMAGEIIQHLREPFKKGAGSVSVVDLRSLAKEAIRLVRNDADRIGATIDLKTSVGEPKAIGDRIQLEQVIINLLLNALDAVQVIKPENRRIEIGVEDAADGSVIVEVRDSGLGVTEKDMDKIFELFFTTKEKGLGMGLAICRSIMDEHGGRIWAEKIPDGGMKFVFSLPGMGAHV